MPLVVETTDEAAKPGKMLSSWSTRAKIFAALLALALYVYILLFIKALYLKNQRLDRIATMAEDTEKLMRNVHAVDQMLAMKVQQLNSLNTEY